MHRRTGAYLFEAVVGVFGEFQIALVAARPNKGLASGTVRNDQGWFSGDVPPLEASGSRRRRH
jgi:hypothetical protein